MSAGPEHKWGCGCVTFWHTFSEIPGTHVSKYGAPYYRKACNTHRPYVHKFGLVVGAEARQPVSPQWPKPSPNASGMPKRGTPGTTNPAPGMYGGLGGVRG